ncbi:MAG TPA: DEAD/DEAH box helicase, partial [Terrimesophilobacter sp.]|nr:DEAD/DEAH box helicase [Terrimesophilobacter sp.]
APGKAKASRGGGPKKARWSADERAARGRAEQRPRGEKKSRSVDRASDSPRSQDRRRDWTPPSERPAAKRRRGPAPEGREQRHVRAERPERVDRTERAERPDRPVRTNNVGRTDRDVRTPRRDSAEWSERGPRRDPSRGPENAPRSDSKFYPSKEERTFTPHDDVVLERLEADAIEATDVDGVSFADLGLGSNITRALGELGAVSPFPIQAATIPVALTGRDVLGRGKTGSGKTIAFGAPLVERLMENGGGKNRKPGRKPRALILAPTRELALQIDRTVQPIARSVGLFTTQIYGGVPQHRQVTALQRGVDIVIGTPGRIEDLVDQGRLDLSEVTITVLDEADHMCDLGFLEPAQRILNLTERGGQKMLFSATLDTAVASLVDEFLVQPSVHEVAGEDQASSTIDHRVLLIEQGEKRQIIEQLAGGDGKTLIFARTRAFAEQLADDLEDAGIRTVALHGDLNQARRTRNLERLTSGRVNVLVATDVAARGIHVDDIALVIQADPPDEYKAYLHRAGRTGRAGRKGTVVTLVNARRRRKMDELLGRAEISPSFDRVRPGDALLDELAAL